MRFQDKVVFITGGTKGLGKAMAQAFLAEGASVAVNSRSDEAVAKFSEEFKGQQVLAFDTDIADYAAMEAMASKVYETLGLKWSSKRAPDSAPSSYLQPRALNES